MSNDLIEEGKKNAAYRAVEENIVNGMVLGIGSGSTVVYAVERLKSLISEKKLSVKCIPTSFQSYQLIIENGLNLTSLDQNPNIDLDIDGADEIDENLNLIKGGGGCLVQEKIIASNSKKVIIIADFRKRSQKLGENWKKGIPTWPAYTTAERATMLWDVPQSRVVNDPDSEIRQILQAFPSDGLF